jgi:hypothetical protein
VHFQQREVVQSLVLFRAGAVLVVDAPAIYVQTSSDARLRRLLRRPWVGFDTVAEQSLERCSGERPRVCGGNEGQLAHRGHGGGGAESRPSSGGCQGLSEPADVHARSGGVLDFTQVDHRRRQQLGRAQHQVPTARRGWLARAYLRALRASSRSW